MEMSETSIYRHEGQHLPAVRGAVEVLFRQYKVILIVSGLVVACMIIAGVWTPKYDARMKILVRRQRVDPMITTQADDSRQFGADQVSEEDLNSEVELLNSRDLLREVVLATNLQNDTGGFRLFWPKSPSIRIDEAVYKLGKQLKIEPIRKSNVISVQYESGDAERARDVLKVLASAYIEKHKEVHRPTGEFKFFDQLTNQYQVGLDRAQKQLIDFNHEHGIVSLQTERDLTLQRGNDFEATAQQANQAMLELQQRLAVLKNQLRSTPQRVTATVSTSKDEQLLGQMKSTLLNLQLKRTELLTKYAPGYAPVREVEQQISDVQASIASSERSAVLGETTERNPAYDWLQQEITKAESEFNAMKARAQSASGISGTYRASAERLNQEESIQRDLVRNAKLQEDNYLLYVKKREEARINDALDQRGFVNVAITEEPSVPAVPVRSPINAALLTLLIAFTVSAPTAYLTDRLDPSFRTPDELAGYLDVPVLATLPKGQA
jgi:uncharacterized protein involved in exopolysaccharide biosynthesis